MEVLSHRKSFHVPETVLDKAVLPIPVSTEERRKSSITLKKEVRPVLVESSLERYRQRGVSQQRRLSHIYRRDSRREQLLGKKVLYVCCGHDGLDSKRFTFERSFNLGIRLFLVEDPKNHLAQTLMKEGLLEDFIEVDMKPRLSLLEDTLAALESVMERVDGFDAVLTFWDDAVGLATRIAESLKLPGNPVHSTDVAHDKHLTREAMRAAGIVTPASHLLKNEKDVLIGAQKVGFPAILKPMYGASSLAVVKVEKEEDVMNAYRNVIHMLKSSYSEGELMGLSFSESEVGATYEESSLSWVVMEELLDGDEVDVDIVLQDGVPIYRCVVDDWPQIEPWFVEMGNSCPSVLSKERQNELVDMAVEVVTKAMGFRNAVLHCELKYTSKGPRIIEINPRMGGGPIWRLHRLSWGSDLIEESLYAALNIKGRPNLPKAPYNCVSSSEKFFQHSMIIPKEFCQVVEAIKHFPNVIEAQSLVTPGEKIVGILDGFPTRTARFVVLADTPADADAYAWKLLEICDIPMVKKLQSV